MTDTFLNTNNGCKLAGGWPFYNSILFVRLVRMSNPTRNVLLIISSPWSFFLILIGDLCSFFPVFVLPILDGDKRSNFDGSLLFNNYCSQLCTMGS